MPGTFGVLLRQALGETRYRRLTPGLFERLRRLDALVREFREALDLTGFQEADTYVVRFFAEPLRASAFLPTSGRAWDLGSGGGSPALPLALSNTKVQWTLVESSTRKALFLEQVKSELGLVNLRVVRARWQDVPLENADLVTSRGLRLDERERERILRGLVPGGRFLWFSGVERLRELRESLRADRRLRVRGPLRLHPHGGFVVSVERRTGGIPS